MKAVQTFTVVSNLPEPLLPLREVAMNLGWINDERAQDLFRRMDRENWEYVRDPARMLATETAERLDELARDQAFTSLAASVRDELRLSLGKPRWFQHRAAARERPLRSVAYFSPEFGVAAALPQYSGGLGVLAGDHLKAANDIGLPLTAIGLFYHHGYFSQSLDVRGGSRSASPGSTPGPWPCNRCPTSASPSTSPARPSTPACGPPRSGASRSTCSTPTSTATPPAAWP